MSSIKILSEVSRLNGGIIRTADATKAGVSRAMLSKLYHSGKLERIAHGQYILPEEDGDELLALSLRSDSLIFSHETALYLHGLSDRVPFVHSITVASNTMPQKSLRDNCKLYYIKPEYLGIGRKMLTTPAGNTVPGYDLERTICDLIRSRNRIGAETYHYAMKAYAISGQKNLNRLGEYAEAMKLTNLVRNQLEVLL